MAKKLATESSKVVHLALGRGKAGPEQGSLHSLVRIHVLGSMRATTYLGADILPRGKKARAILGYLSVTAQRVSRTRLASMLWDRASDAQARSSFRGCAARTYFGNGSANERIDFGGSRDG